MNGVVLNGKYKPYFVPHSDPDHYDFPALYLTFRDLVRICYRACQLECYTYVHIYYMCINEVHNARHLS